MVINFTYQVGGLFGKHVYSIFIVVERLDDAIGGCKVLKASIRSYTALKLSYFHVKSTRRNYFAENGEEQLSSGAGTHWYVH